MNETKAIKNISKNKPKSQNSLIKYCSTKYIFNWNGFWMSVIMKEKNSGTNQKLWYSVLIVNPNIFNDYH